MRRQTQPRPVLLHRAATQQRIDDAAERRDGRPGGRRASGHRRGRDAKPFELQPGLIRRRDVILGQTAHHVMTQHFQRCRGHQQVGHRSRRQRRLRGLGQIARAHELHPVGPPGWQRKQRVQCLCGVNTIERRQLGKPLWRASPPPGRKRIDDRPPADRAGGGRVAQHEPVTCQRADRPVQRQSRQHRAVRLDPVAGKRRNACRHVCGAKVQVHRSIRRATGAAPRRATRGAHPCAWSGHAHRDAATQSPRVTASFDSRWPVTLTATR